ncbi:hypothetical protein P7C73_g2348, partial [Tremellales sp. Uapishka_1]
MSFPAALRPAARSAYRSVLRSARITFQGDPVRHIALLTALRHTFSSPTLATPPPSSSTSAETAANPAPDFPGFGPKTEPEPVVVDTKVSEEELASRIDEWKEIAVFLKRNVVQGELDEGKGSFKLRVTPHTELGDNASTKSPPKLPTTPFPNRSKRRKCGE